MSEYYVVVKFTSGEQCFAVLEEEDTQYVQLLNPMLIKTTVDFSVGKEHITAVPLCQFSEDKTYLIEKKNVMFIKRMHTIFVPHYNRIVEEHNEVVHVRKDRDGNYKKAEDLCWEDPENLTSEEIQKRIEMLTEIIEKEESIESNFIEGNDTVH